MDITSGQESEYITPQLEENFNFMNQPLEQSVNDKVSFNTLKFPTTDSQISGNEFNLESQRLIDQAPNHQQPKTQRDNYNNNNRDLSDSGIKYQSENTYSNNPLELMRDQSMMGEDPQEIYEEDDEDDQGDYVPSLNLDSGDYEHPTFMEMGGDFDNSQISEEEFATEDLLQSNQDPGTFTHGFLLNNLISQNHDISDGEISDQESLSNLNTNHKENDPANQTAMQSKYDNIDKDELGPLPSYENNSRSRQGKVYSTVQSNFSIGDSQTDAFSSNAKCQSRDDNEGGQDAEGLNNQNYHSEDPYGQQERHSFEDDDLDLDNDQIQINLPVGPNDEIFSMEQDQPPSSQGGSLYNEEDYSEENRDRYNAEHLTPAEDRKYHEEAGSVDDPYQNNFGPFTNENYNSSPHNSGLNKISGMDPNHEDGDYTSYHDEYSSKNPFNKVQSLTANIYSQLVYASKPNYDSQQDKFQSNKKFPKMNYIKNHTESSKMRGGGEGGDPFSSGQFSTNQQDSYNSQLGFQKKGQYGYSSPNKEMGTFADQHSHLLDNILNGMASTNFDSQMHSNQDSDGKEYYQPSSSREASGNPNLKSLNLEEKNPDFIQLKGKSYHSLKSYFLEYKLTVQIAKFTQ